MTREEPPKLDFSGALTELAAPAYVLDREGRIRWLNQASVEIFGDLRGRPFVDHVAPEHRQLARANFARKVVGQTTTIFDVNAFDRRGERVTLRITSAPLREHGEVVGIFGIGVPQAAPADRSRSVLDDLTPRQQEVLRLLTEGLETAEIARRLGVAEETARNHIRGLLRATGAHSRLEVVLLGLRHGFVAPPVAHAARESSQPPDGR